MSIQHSKKRNVTSLSGHALEGFELEGIDQNTQCTSLDADTGESEGIPTLCTCVILIP